MNERDKQAHALDEKPVHPRMQSTRFRSAEDLLAAHPPNPPRQVERWRIICPDNAVWPISNVDSNAPDEQGFTLEDLRALKYEDYYEEGNQRAMYEASKADNNNPLLSTLSYVMMGTASLCFIVIAMIILAYKFGGQEAPPPEAVLPLFLLGAVAAKPRAVTLDDWKRSKEEEVTEVKKSHGKDFWVPGVILDSPALEAGAIIWDVILPFSEWMKYGCEEGMYRPDIPRFRKLGALMGAMAVGGICMAVGMQLIGIMLGGIPGAIGGLALGAGLGWLGAPRFLGLRPIIVARRVVEDGCLTLKPIPPSFCRHIPEQEYTDIQMEALQRLQSDSSDTLYEPVVYRATTFYEDMKQTDEKADFSSPSDTLQKIQIGTMLLMGFGSIGLLIFAALATT